MVPLGTLYHLLWECETSKACRLRLASPLLLQSFQSAFAPGQAEMAVWTRGLMPAPHALVPPTQLFKTFQWVVRPADGNVTGTVYTDGSLIDGPPYLDGLCKRLGWAFMALDRHDRVTASARGAPAV